MNNYNDYFFLFLLPLLTTGQQLSCKVEQPTGWETGLDGSGLRSSTIENRNVGQNVTYKCPGVKVGERDRKSSYTAACLEEFPGYAEMKYDFGFPWPQCQCPEVVSCRVHEDSGLSQSSTRYAFDIGAGDDPGMDLRVPMPKSTKVWEIIISWDILTLNENIDVACKTQGVRQERTDFQGQQYRFSPINTTYSIVGDDEVLHLDLGFYFRNATVRTDSQMWHYPCIERLECEAQSAPAKITVMSLLLVFGLVGAVLLTCSIVCGSIVWCLKRDRAYGVRPFTGRFVEERPDSADSHF